MDSASPHVSERIPRVLGENRIMAIVFQAHTTHLIQALDLVLFGAMKTIRQTADGDFGDDSVWDQMTTLLQTYEQVSTSFTIRGAFKKTGLTAYVSSKPVRLIFNEEILRENPDFRRSENAIFQLTNGRSGGRTGSGFSIPASLPGVPMNKQHLPSLFCPAILPSHYRLAQRHPTF
jgi:hypothetical protein